MDSEGVRVRLLYLDLLKKCLTRSFLNESYDRIPKNVKTPWRFIRYSLYSLINRLLSPWNLVLVHSLRPTGETMIGMERLNNLQDCIVDVLKQGVPGDLIETGVWRGGGTIFMKAVLDVYGDEKRVVWVADSFQGLPKPNSEKYPEDKGDRFWEQSLGVSVTEVKRNFEKYGLLDDQVHFIEGFFSDTMPTAPMNQLAVLRLDGDMYESTIVVLENLYKKVSIGGYVIVDDYGCVAACKKATDDFRAKYNITEPLVIIDWTGVFWQRLR